MDLNSKTPGLLQLNPIAIAALAGVMVSAPGTMAAPAIFITLARWGKNPVFDRAWTLASLLTMGLLSMLFAFNFWVA
jgi:hypothetical protein